MKRMFWGSMLVLAASLTMVGCSGAEVEGRAPEDTAQTAQPNTTGTPAAPATTNTNPNPNPAEGGAPASGAAGTSAPAEPTTSGTPQGEGPSGTAGTTNPTGGVEPGASGEAEKPQNEAKKITGVPADAAQRAGAASSGSESSGATGSGSTAGGN
jgi:hypothetical protein